MKGLTSNTEGNFACDKSILKNMFFILVIVQSNRLEELTTDVTCFDCRYINVLIINFKQIYIGAMYYVLPRLFQLVQISQ